MLFAFVLPFNQASALLAPPTNERKDPPSAMDVVQAKMAMGYPEFIAKSPFATGKTFRFTIIDAGFHGLDAWLKKHPDMKNKVEYHNLRRSKKPSGSHHGFNVLQVAAKVMPQAEFILIEPGTLDLRKSLDLMAAKGSFFASMSIDVFHHMGDFNPSKTSLYSWISRLEEYQITLLVAAGNYRKKAHYFPYRDHDGDGILEFTDKGERAEQNVIYINKGMTAKVDLFWNEWPTSQSKLELQLLRKGKVVARGRLQSGVSSLRFKYTSKKSGKYELRVIGKDIVQSESLRFVLRIGGAFSSRGDFNGYGAIGISSQAESPFIVSVGAFGMGENGGLEPSLFSSIGHSYSGELVPHILGPGQVVVEGSTLNGTSFATPFVAALYAKFASYNIKNFIEETTSFKRFIPGLVADEKGRWGVPDFEKLLAGRCSGSDKVENFSHRFDDKNLIVHFDFSRNCMEKLSYRLDIGIRGPQHQGPKLVADDVVRSKNKQGKYVPLRFSASYKSETRDIKNQAVEIKIPLRALPRSIRGKEVTPFIQIATRAQWDPVSIDPKAQPTLSIALPESAPMPETMIGLKALNIAQQAVASGAYTEAVELSQRVLSDEAITAADRLKAYAVQISARIAQADMSGLIETSSAALGEAKDKDHYRWLRGMSYLATGQYKKAQTDFSNCLKSSSKRQFIGCNIGMALLEIHQGGDDFGAISKRLNGRLQSSALADDMSAQALALYLGQQTPREYLDQARSSAKDRTQRVLDLSQAHYYLGEFGVLKGQQTFAREWFEKSLSSGGITLERAMATYWLNQRKKPLPVETRKPVHKSKTPQVLAITKESGSLRRDIQKQARKDSVEADKTINQIRAILKSGKMNGTPLVNKQRREMYEVLTYLHLQKQDLDGAIRWGEMVQNKGIEIPDTLVALGVAQTLRGMDTKAQVTFEQCLRLPLDEPYKACELWLGILRHPAASDVSGLLSPSQLRLVKAELNGDYALADARTLFLYPDLIGFKQLEEKIAKQAEKGTAYEGEMSFYLGVWRLLKGDKLAAKMYFITAAASAHESMERVWGRLWLETYF